MNRALEDVFSGRLDTSYHRHGPSAEERARYLQHLRGRGWKRATVIGTACKLAAFASRVNIDSEGGVTEAQIEAAANDWMKQPGHCFRRAIGPHKEVALLPRPLSRTRVFSCASRRSVSRVRAMLSSGARAFSPYRQGATRSFVDFPGLAGTTAPSLECSDGDGCGAVSGSATKPALELPHCV